MPSATYILCPGQGAQVVGMGKAFFDKSAVAKSLFEQADAILGFSLSGLCFDGPDDRLNQTDISQPALYVAGVASYRSAVEDGVIDPAAVTAFAGLSLGEYTALHLAGVFSFEDGLKLVAARGRAMQDAAVAVPSGMVAIMGADEAAISALCDEARGGEVLVPANYNAPGQIVVSGSTGACERVLKAAEAKGFKAVALKVAGAFHSPIMQPGADKMKSELEKATFAVPQKPVFSNVTAAEHTDTASIKNLLVDQIVSPVRWEQTMVKIAAVADARFVELAPGRTLAGLAKRINRRLPVESLGA
ncbi:ACP S-malonyltransferase [Humisphaera borealis]|uniref:Malonyl CoA-acyl carrier protein transacylase n=1 Tax=Humisphaera borealis TaxID=2807512 RepID=A0A7M2WSC8_9BACT|nr:ACP S-malonyltransferase [Humisphaera borealis]QOV88343.1 ACP S-malonyltransferase [Humisphaera borealis]